MTSTNKQFKQDIVTKLRDQIKDAKSITLVDFSGMNIGAQQDLKKRLKESKAKMVVAKNTLIKIALTEAKMPKEVTEGGILTGQTAIVLGNEDPVFPIQTIGKFAKENEALKFKAGIMDGVYQDKANMQAISALPSKEVLVGQTVGTVAGPMYGLIMNLQNKMQELIGILSAKTAA